MNRNRLLALTFALLFPQAAFAADAPPAASKPASDSTQTNDEEDKPAQTSKIPTLEDRIRPVSGSLFSRAGRHELTPEFGLSLDDAFFSKYMFGLRYAYHVIESVSVGLRAGYAISTSSGNVAVCDSTTGVCAAPTKDQLVRAPGNMSLVAGIEGAWAPLYGKINVVGEKALHFDTFLEGGLDGVQYADPSGDTPGASKFTFGFHVGVGQHYVINDFTAVRIDLRDVIYRGTRDEVGVATPVFENQLMLTIGLSFFLPTRSNPDA
jgi:outer membrane beta-barrel protein